MNFLNFFAPPAMIVAFALGMSLTGCKTISPSARYTSSALGTEAESSECGPEKTLYFHWLSDEAAANWEKLAGVAQPLPEEKELTSRTRPWMAVTDQLINDLVARESSGDNKAGGGIYLDGEPSSSSGYGNRLFIFRITGPDGKGVTCAQDPNFKAMNDKTVGSERSKLPLLVNYVEPGLREKWFISPRAPDRAHGEQVLFDRPHSGDAELLASNMITGNTRLQLLSSFAATLTGSQQQSAKGFCQQSSDGASIAFRRKLLCQLLPERLDQALAIMPHTPMTPDERKAVSSIQHGLIDAELSSPAISKLLIAIGPQAICSYFVSNVDSQEQLDLYRVCTEQHGHLTLTRQSPIPAKLSWSTLRYLQKAEEINIGERVEFDGCDSEMALTAVDWLRVQSPTSICLPHFGKLTNVGVFVLMGSKVTNLKSFNALAEISQLHLIRNSDLTDLSGLERLRVIKYSVQIYDNASLTSLKPLLNPALYPQAKDMPIPEFCIARNPRIPPQETEQLIQILSSKGWTKKQC